MFRDNERILKFSWKIVASKQNFDEDHKLYLAGLFIVYRTWEMQLLTITIYVMTFILYIGKNTTVTFAWKKI